MANNTKKAAGGLAAVLAACALATPLLVDSEGVVPATYIDPVGIPTACVGHTGPEVKVGQKFTLDQCMDQLGLDMVRHGLAIDKCIKVLVPTKSRASFTALSFNIGPSKFCSSTLLKKLNAGDLAGACDQISVWNKGHKGLLIFVLPGLVKTRAIQRAYCEKGLADGVAA